MNCETSDTIPRYVTLALIALYGIVFCGVVVAGARSAHRKVVNKKDPTTISSNADVSLGHKSQLNLKANKKNASGDKTNMPAPNDGVDRDVQVVYFDDSKENEKTTPNDIATSIKPKMKNNIVVFRQNDDSDSNNSKTSTVKDCILILPLEVWSKKRCFLLLATHIVDQATDIGVILEFYQIYQTSRNGDQS